MNDNNNINNITSISLVHCDMLDILEHKIF